MTRAFIFDLYGTLLRRRGLGAHRDLPRALGIRGSDWIRFVREELMVRSFETAEQFATFVRQRMVPEGEADLETEILRIVADEHASVSPYPGARTLLSFLRDRGYKLALVSNLASSHKAPIDTFELAKHFDVIYLSCDEGRQKPDPFVFEEVCRRLEVAPAEAVVVGDSLANDLRPARQAGLRAIGVGRDEDGWMPSVAGLGLRSLEALQPLMPNDHPALGRGLLARTAPVPDDEQGSYNLVYRIDPENGEGRAHYLKRYALPESVAVEELAYRLQRELDLGDCDAFPIGQPESLLVIEEAPGTKWAGEMDEAIAHEIGRHMSFAYVFSNADARPRNAFLSRRNGSPRLTMIDLEHCFFDLAIDTAGISDPFDPHVIDATSDIEARIVRRVLSEKTTRRTRRTFLREEEAGEACLASFGRGWCELYYDLKKRKDEIVEILRERIHREPYLVIGTRRYRRAMADVDVFHIARRLDENPEESSPKREAGSDFLRYQ